MERRRKLRIETRVHLDCRIPALPSKGVLLDISRDGCRLRVPMTKLDPGGTILLDLPGASRFLGRVVWTKRIDAGIQFVRPLGWSSSVALGIEQPEPAPRARLQVNQKSHHPIPRVFFGIGCAGSCKPCRESPASPGADIALTID